MRAAVTGATGFIGRRLLDRLLESGWEVVAISRGIVSIPQDWSSKAIEFRQADVCDESEVFAALHGCDVVFHLASSPSNDWRESYRVNVEGTRSVFGAACRSQVSKFVHFSTIAVYSLKNHQRGMVVSEDCAKHPEDRSMGPYYHTKALAEEVVLSERGDATLAATVVRPGIVIGPGGPVYFQELGYRLPWQGLAVVKNPDRKLAMVALDDLVNGILACLDRSTNSPPIYNFVTSDPVTVRQYLLWSRSHKQFPKYTIRLPYIVPWFAALIYECAVSLKILKPGRISRAQIAWKQADVNFSAASARDHLGWIDGPILDGTGSGVSSRSPEPG